MERYTKIELLNNRRYLELLSNSFPTITSAVGEVVNLNAILNLPKGTEHFLTDIHGEDEAFNHVMQNASGAVRRKVFDELESTVGLEDLDELITLIYYPEEKIDLIERQKSQEHFINWCELTIYRLVKVCRSTASKYTRSKVRKALPKDFAYIMEELLQEDEHRLDKKDYYSQIIKSLVNYGSATHFIIEISEVIKRLSVDHLHIIGDLFDRGPGPHLVMDTLMSHHSLDIQWGNHDVLWMGAAAGNAACIANVIRMAMRYGNNSVLEDGYGISLLSLASFADRTYGNDPCTKFKAKMSGESSESEEAKLVARMHKAISVIQFKLEEEIIARRPEYDMKERMVLHGLNLGEGTVNIEGTTYPLNDTNFPTMNPEKPWELTEEEKFVVERLVYSFEHCDKLQKHIRFIYAKGSMYLTYNNNLLFHACVPLNEDGSFKASKIGGKDYAGKALMDKFDQMAREAYLGKKKKPNAADFLWFLWCHKDSPVFGKDKMATFERYFINDKTPHKENYTPYFKLIDSDLTIALDILKEFGLNPEEGHIVNGHVPVKARSGESPIRAGGKLFVIDGGFAKAYQKTTGIAGYTLTYNSYGLTLISHEPFESVDKAVRESVDIISTYENIETTAKRKRVRDTDNGKIIKGKIANLEMLIEAYERGIVTEKFYS